MNNTPEDRKTEDNKDTIYSHKREKIQPFIFDDGVAEVFEDMINRSVPGYPAVISMLPFLAEEYCRRGTNCYDLGCSLGASSLSLEKGISFDDCRIIAVDNSESMVRQCRTNVEREHRKTPIDIRLADIKDVTIENASIVILNFTLQFFKPDARFDIIRRIYDGLVPGGILVLSEKVKFPASEEQNFQFRMHHEFKKMNGYSAMEISQKRTALENVLIPDTIDHHHSRLTVAGFSHSFLWFQCFNFISIVAVK